MAYQLVCEISPMEPSCIHDRYGEFWGDHAPGLLLAADYSEDDFRTMAADDFLTWLQTTWEYASTYIDAERQHGVEHFNECERHHMQRIALDYVRLRRLAKERTDIEQAALAY